MDVFSIAAGAAGIGLLWFLKLAGSKGLPAALAWAKARGNAGAVIEALKGDIADAHRKIAGLEGRLKPSFASVYAEIDELKGKFDLINELKVKLGLAPTPAAVPSDDPAEAARVQPKPPAFPEGQS